MLPTHSASSTSLRPDGFIRIWHLAARPRGVRLDALLLAGLLLSGGPLRAQAGKAPRVPLPDSIVDIPAAAHLVGVRRPPPAIVRTALTADEEAQELEFELALRMRNFDELQARVQRGERLTPDELAAHYFPNATDQDALVAWVRAQGLTVSHTDRTHLGIFVRGPVSLVRQVFQTDFARVSYGGKEFTSAISAPSMPAGLVGPLLGIDGLQPHLQAHKLAALGEYHPLFSNKPPYSPAEIQRTYGATGLGVNGTGQTIAIVIDTFPLDGDLTSFWTTCGVTQSLSNIQKIQVGTATLPAPSGEESVDVELTSALAPAATIRVYAVGTLTTTLISQAYQRIIADLPSQPGLHQLSLSFGLRESDTSRTTRQTQAQYFATLAASGVTIFASTGDGGSNPDDNENYDPNALTQTELPAADASVTGVGGTTLNLDATSGTVSSETAWSGSGGGVSVYVNRPSWQTGTGVPAGDMRLVPDVAALGDTATGGFIIVNATQYRVGGTSLSAPIWAGFCALINQARATAGRTPLGLLGPKVYPLIGTTSFRDITSGSNGAFSAGAGYDLATGIGVPSMAALVPALSAASFAPEISAQPANQGIKPGGSTTFSVTAAGNPTPTYQWQRRPAGSTAWSNLSEGGNYTGTASAMLTVSKALEAMNGDAFRCVVTNVNGNTTSSPATMVVSFPLTITTLAGSTGAAGIGSTDGTGSAAQFRYPTDICIDSSGNAYLSDTYNQTIRKITPAGDVTTLAGLAGVKGSADGTGSAARFYYPLGVCVDAAGNVYVADSYNDAIRKITSAGVVTTFAGTPGNYGTADGTGSAARFYNPCDVAVDAAGNLYVADTLNETIRKITPAGAVTTFAGAAGTIGRSDGAGSAARFNSPEGVTVDASGNLYVADTTNCTIRKITADAVVSTLAGLAGTSGTADGVGNLVRFYYPYDLTVDASGTVFVADSENETIRRISPAGIVSTVAGLATVNGAVDGVGSAARLDTVSGLNVAPNGTIYLADTDNNLIRTAMTRSAPEFLTHPTSQTVTAGASVTFTVLAVGAPAPTYQWYKSGAAIGGATSDTLTIASAQTGDAASYTATASNTAGSATSNAATLTVNVPVTPPSGGGGGGGGGGGALPAWFAGALALLGAARSAQKRPRR